MKKTTFLAALLLTAAAPLFATGTLVNAASKLCVTVAPCGPRHPCIAVFDGWNPS